MPHRIVILCSLLKKLFTQSDCNIKPINIMPGLTVILIYYSVFFFFVTFGATGFTWGRFLVGLSILALAFTGLALDPGAFERLGLCFFNCGGLGATTTFRSGGELFSGQDVNTFTSWTFWPLISGGWPQVAITSKLTFSIHLRDRDKDTEGDSDACKQFQHQLCHPAAPISHVYLN